MTKKLTNPQVSALRALFRAGLVCVTAFGLKLSAEQVAAVQLLGEAVLAGSVAFTNSEG